MSCKHQKNQLPLNLTLVIPDSKPDIERVLRVTSTPEIDKIAAISGKVIITGNVCLLVEYVACSHLNNQPVHFAEFKAPFATFIKHRQAQCSRSASISARVEFQEVQLIDRRTIVIFIILETVILKINQSKMLIQSQVCPSQHICNRPISTIDLCSTSHCSVDCSVSQPCSCSICQDD